MSRVAMRRGSILILVLTFLSMVSVLAIALMSHTYYAMRTTKDHTRHEQFMSAAESVLRYGVAWYQKNYDLVHGDNEPGSWRLRFTDIELSPGRQGHALVTVLPGSEQSEVRAQLFTGKTMLAAAKCRTKRDEKDGGRLETLDWSYEKA